MRGYIQPGNTITLPAPYAVASGDGLLVGVEIVPRPHDELNGPVL